MNNALSTSTGKKKKIRGRLLLMLSSSITLIGTTAGCLYFSFLQFQKEQKNHVEKANEKLISSYVQSVDAEISKRLNDFQIIVPRLFGPDAKLNLQQNIFKDLDPLLENNLLSGAVFEYDEKANKFLVVSHYRNRNLQQNQSLNQNVLSSVYNNHPLPLQEFFQAPQVKILNRSINQNQLNNQTTIGITTFLLPSSFLTQQEKKVAIALDLLEDFLHIKQSTPESSKTFLIFQNGTLLSHPEKELLDRFSITAFDHPVAKEITNNPLSTSTSFSSINGKTHALVFRKMKFANLFAVVQTHINHPLVIEKIIMDNRLLLGIPVLVPVVLSFLLILIMFVLRGKRNRAALDELPDEDLEKSDDTVKEVTKKDKDPNLPPIFQTLYNQLNLLSRIAKKKDALQEAKKHSQLLLLPLSKPPTLNLAEVELLTYFNPSENGEKNLWHAQQDQGILSLYFGSISAPKLVPELTQALVARCFSTLIEIQLGRSFRPEEIFTFFNRVLFQIFHGKAPMKLCVVQLNKDTGLLQAYNAGHYGPVRLMTENLQNSPNNSDKNFKGCGKLSCELGDPLGMKMDFIFKTSETQLEPSQVIFLFSDGIQNARGPEKIALGEQNLIEEFSKTDTLSLSAAKTNIIKTLNNHIRDFQQNDDMSFLLLKWKREQLNRKQEESSDNLCENAFESCDGTEFEPNGTGNFIPPEPSKPIKSLGKKEPKTTSEIKPKTISGLDIRLITKEPNARQDYLYQERHFKTNETFPSTGKSRGRKKAA